MRAETCKVSARSFNLMGFMVRRRDRSRLYRKTNHVSTERQNTTEKGRGNRVARVHFAISGRMGVICLEHCLSVVILHSIKETGGKTCGTMGPADDSKGDKLKTDRKWKILCWIC